MSKITFETVNSLYETEKIAVYPSESYQDRFRCMRLENLLEKTVEKSKKCNKELKEILEKLDSILDKMNKPVSVGSARLLFSDEDDDDNEKSMFESLINFIKDIFRKIFNWSHNEHFLIK